MTTVTLQTGDVVADAPGYYVVQGGTYEALELVPCNPSHITGAAICAFLAATCVGLPTDGDITP